jgi:pimeloyl-ACP methyl ester carboxylesterase
MRHLGIERAHVVGHSSSANIALQLALDAPEAVHSLALLEPALYSVLSAQTSRVFVGTAVQLYRSDDKAGAVDTFLRGTCGPGYRTVLDQALPGAFDQHVTDADTFFGQELPALQQWSFTPQEARRVTQPVLAVIGAKSQALIRFGANDRNCCSHGCPTSSPSSLPTRRTCCRCRIPAAWPRGWRLSSPVTCSQSPLERRQCGV